MPVSLYYTYLSLYIYLYAYTPAYSMKTLGVNSKYMQQIFKQKFKNKTTKQGNLN